MRYIIRFICAVAGFAMIAGVMVLWMLVPDLKQAHPYALTASLYLAFLGGIFLVDWAGSRWWYG